MMIHVLALLAVSNGLPILYEPDKQKRELAIEKVVELIPNPGDQFTVKTFLEDETVLERLKAAMDAIAA